MQNKSKRTRLVTVAAMVGLVAFSACSDGHGDPFDGELSDVYEFTSRFSDESSVSYSGQTFRHVLIDEMKSYLGRLTERIDSSDYSPSAADVVSDLTFYFDFDYDSSSGVDLNYSTTPSLLQDSYADISSSGKTLLEKLAGNDDATDHKDWDNGGFSGWDGAASPQALVEAWFQAVGNLAADRVNGTIPNDPDGNPIESVFVSEAGLDYQQLLQKFLLGAVAFSQGADDYLDDDVEGKGLLADNVDPDDGDPYTALEHAWDEGFGYFGAARDYKDYTDEELAGKGGRDSYSLGYYDSNADGNIDLLSEFNFGASVNAGKRDFGAIAATDFTNDAMTAFIAGRTLITLTDGELSSAELDELRGYRDSALTAWENAIAATAVHYINDVLQDMNDAGTSDYSFSDHAKHWGELKGFVLSLQFNPHSPLSDSQFDQINDLIGDAPVLGTGPTANAYKTDLVSARTILGNAYGFDADNLGDADGENGW